MPIKSLCELLGSCEFFIFEMKNSIMARHFKDRYCYNCKDACARYMIARSSGLDYIPRLLYPNEYDKALEIIGNRNLT
ncbi:MAG: hypothetical protein HQK77_03040 [Desulfobacterales bacterium]|nr:hypothetical protein [Desulfobacterales bacterium]